MELILGIIIGIVIVVVGIVISRTIDELEDKIKMLEQKIDLDSSLAERVQALEDELRFEKKANGTNVSKLVKDVIRLKEHLTYIQNK